MVQICCDDCRRNQLNAEETQLVQRVQMTNVTVSDTGFSLIDLA
jgi:hypothetical protein